MSVHPVASFVHSMTGGRLLSLTVIKISEISLIGG